MPRIERLHQNTPAWHRWRRQGIGSSDAPVIMGDARFRTRRLLWSVKTGAEKETTAGPPAWRGRALEQAARRAYERELAVQMEPLCLVHEQYKWMRASLDGLSFDGSVVLEIKCPLNPHDIRKAKEGRVPAHYYAQLQHQLEVTSATEAHYWSFDGRAGVLVRVTPDREYIKHLIETEAEFWRLVEEKCWPDAASEELDLSSHPSWRSTALAYRAARISAEQSRLEEQRLRAILGKLATARRTYGCGVELIKNWRKGAVEYSAVPELRGVDLEQYRKPQVQVVTINLN
jgi:putative phage-type endonuclease